MALPGGKVDRPLPTGQQRSPPVTDGEGAVRMPEDEDVGSGRLPKGRPCLVGSANVPLGMHR